MKRLITAVLAVVLVLALAAPAMAQVDVTTGVQVTQGGGNAPVVKAKWETPDDDPVTPGTQVLPTLEWQGVKEVCLYVVVTDVEDAGTVAQVVADVYHPQGCPEEGSIKYDNLALTIVPWSEGLTAFGYAHSHNLVAYNSPFDYAEVLEELNQDDARVWKVCFDLHTCQPWGDYTVSVAAVDSHGNTSSYFSNTFNFIQTCCFEIDFTSVTYPPVMISSSVVAGGNTVWGDNIATIRSRGNTNAYICVTQDDMGFGQYVGGAWKVTFDARMGPKVDDADSTQVLYNPEVCTQFPNILEQCDVMKLDFSIHVIFAVPGTYNGTMQLCCSSAPYGCNDLT